ncbi:dsRBD fold-containing protein [Phycicoccus sp. Soil748]|uniref:dsRBD fold-containing protein n=1 Tax=Intrasporangiaceae TaxID=85021 RepID=UPI0007035161|nr:dsRBD fold-containing protein [Phycicoccus sp. Soil748]KRE55024.1 hypothetical protein ASG70_06185 [Phycicoccus sp. Soil748]
MKAQPGDRIVLAPVVVEGPVRDGEVLEARGPGGTPPFLVKWSDGHEGLIYPGPGAVLRIGAPPHHEDGHHEGHDGNGRHEEAGHGTSAAPRAAGGDSPHHVRDWQVRISIFGSDDETDAHVLLVADSPNRLSASGHSERSPHDLVTPEIGEEVAVARALRRLADQLLETAEGDIEDRTGEHDVTLRPR